MMGPNLTRPSVSVTALALALWPTCSQASAAAGIVSQATSTSVVKQAPRQPPSLVPADFVVPVLIEGEGFQLVPLGPERVKADFDAYMSSIDHLQKTFSRSTSWPRQGITASEAMQDMQNEQARFKNRASFAYAVLTPDGLRERGSVYVSPSPVEGFDASVRMWVTKADYDAGFDAELYRWVTGWIKKDWPFAKVAYPGRSIDWTTWDSLVAAQKAKQSQAN
jgi:hypothetical protein